MIDTTSESVISMPEAARRSPGQPNLSTVCDGTCAGAAASNSKPSSVEETLYQRRGAYSDSSPRQRLPATAP